ncbi:hypothetical protein EPA93_35025 [Ktedonosporobacter rubrisoli]|uniref:Uncharacterized protein n=1 Tax=Ktedonosporobacter rubrisoli TaxID=2509675 RepID=A0A4P6JYV7_KTERU|nr:ABC transporter permease [Ktedonosporobacter rubrisoli]QBD80904.1 hypothetical protein EPA93_35025 [Ktedonosporobacter rubrisoli]
MNNAPWSIPQHIFSTPTGRVYAVGTWKLRRNELFKLRRSRLFWALFGLDLGLVIFAWALQAYNAYKNPTLFQPGQLLGGSDALMYLVGKCLLLSRRAGEVIVLIWSALVFGSELRSGAVKLVFSRGIRRGRYLLAKYLALVQISLFLLLASLLLSLLLANGLLLLHRPAPSVLSMDIAAWRVLGLIALGMLENFLLCLLFGAALSILFRSALVGMLVSCGYLLFEDIIAPLLPAIGRSLHSRLGNQIMPFLLEPNLNAFYAHWLPPNLQREFGRIDGVLACSMTSKGCVPVDLRHAMLVAVAWGLLLFLASIILFVKRDVKQ